MILGRLGVNFSVYLLTVILFLEHIGIPNIIDFVNLLLRMMGIGKNSVDWWLSNVTFVTAFKKGFTSFSFYFISLIISPGLRLVKARSFCKGGLRWVIKWFLLDFSKVVVFVILAYAKIFLKSDAFIVIFWAFLCFAGGLFGQMVSRGVVSAVLRSIPHPIILSITNKVYSLTALAILNHRYLRLSTPELIGFNFCTFPFFFSPALSNNNSPRAF